MWVLVLATIGMGSAGALKAAQLAKRAGLALLFRSSSSYS
jgi:hypothetical protein